MKAEWKSENIPDREQHKQVIWGNQYDCGLWITAGVEARKAELCSMKRPGHHDKSLDYILQATGSHQTFLSRSVIYAAGVTEYRLGGKF